MTKDTPTDSQAGEWLDILLWEYRMDVQRFTPGADLLIDKAKDKYKAAIQAKLAEAEQQARANALYEAADLVIDDPLMYKRLWDRRKEVLAELQHRQALNERSE